MIARSHTPWAHLCAICMLVLLGCDPEETAVAIPTDGSHPQPSSEWKQVVPGPGVPDAITTYASNNNLDIKLFDDSLYLVFRTAPSHFASDKALIHILRADDPRDHTSWVHEETIHTGKDLREPRFFEFEGELYMYVTELGDNTLTFEPGRTIGTVRTADGSWETPRLVFEDGRIVWRTKNRHGKVYMSTYRGGENIYQEWSLDNTLETMFLTTSDGWTWQPVSGEQPVVVTGGISETAFEFTESGDLYATLRNEAGDFTGFGTRFCSAKAADLMDWTCTAISDPRKYDSPYMFRFRDWIYLIGRWSPKPFELNPGEPVSEERFWENQTTYSGSIKRTGLYAYKTDTLSVEEIELFPSTGDTSFAAGVWLSETEHLVFNYSSDINGPEQTWIEGQLGGSQIYSAILRFE